MSKPLIVTVPHQLGQAEARRRLAEGVTTLKARFADKVSSVDETWTENRLDVEVKALGQTITAALDVREDQVEIEVQLPWMLAMIANKAKGVLQKEGRILLEKK